jgi:hypothetical protein
MSNTNDSSAVPIYDIWHRYIHERSLGGLTSLYAGDAVLKSAAVLVLEGHTDGVLTGKEALTQHFVSFFAMLSAEWYRPGPGFKDKDVLI